VRKYGDSADAYTDPETGILKNKLGLTTEKSLERAEAEISALRSQELARSPIAGNFDLSHLKAIMKPGMSVAGTPMIVSVSTLPRPWACPFALLRAGR